MRALPKVAPDRSNVAAMLLEQRAKLGVRRSPGTAQHRDATSKELALDAIGSDSASAADRNSLMRSLIGSGSSGFFDNIAPSHNAKTALDAPLELANVIGPVVVDQSERESKRKLQLGPPMTVEKSASQLEDIFFSIT